MKKSFTNFAIFMFLILPAFATDDIKISPNENDAACDEGTLETRTGPVALEAAWAPNTLRLHWKNNDTTVLNNTCTYDGGITLPTTPTRPGYDFVGWSVRSVPACANNMLNYVYVTGTDYISKSIDDTACGKYQRSGTSCSDSIFDKLVPGAWRVDYTYDSSSTGTFLGSARCSAKSGNNNGYEWEFNPGGNTWDASDGELESAGDGKYCWCKIDRAESESGSVCRANTTPWVYYYVHSDYEDCANKCSYFCATQARSGVGNNKFLHALLWPLTQ